ncbi:MAG: hypothetical protein JST38_15795 [Bacteroidetes bacterium]|nr:hypothetical protein [Bacteroidota bacterium]MBS1942334.1 hypothetical protein [Bacteroidota bacterium]
MEGLQERIVSARAGLKLLKEEQTRANATIASLEASMQNQSREAEVLRARIKELEQENGVLRTAKAPEGETGREGKKEKIDELVQEIDRCLALLNN